MRQSQAEQRVFPAVEFVTDVQAADHGREVLADLGVADQFVQDVAQGLHLRAGQEQQPRAWVFISSRLPTGWRSSW